jgi:Fe-S oxidoreductase
MKKPTVEISLAGTTYCVPADYTILTAMEYCGFRIVRGCGCRGGFCGACATAYRLPDRFNLRFGLACQTKVEEGMQLVTLPFFPGHRGSFNMQSLEGPYAALMTLYPEIGRCLGCNTCSKACPEGISTMDVVQNALRGNLRRAAEISFDCIMCGLCAVRCPAEITPYNIALFARRVHVVKDLGEPEYLGKRIAEIAAGVYGEVLDRYMTMSEADMKEVYEKRDFERL